MCVTMGWVAGLQERIEMLLFEFNLLFVPDK